MNGSETRASTNPFVGPRPFEPGERLYGRDREIRKLDNLLGAERVVLLYSPSGAGKSSLVQAGLMPQLKGSFDVWGPTRVNQEPPAGVDGNRYVLSTMAGFEEEVPEKRRRPPEVLAGQTLHDYLEGRPRRRSAPPAVLLIFDQFEEVLTVDPLAVGAKRDFFDQLGELLRDPQVWALFVLREDYLAPLDPYAQQVPTHLRNRFRIDLLGLDGAREAMVNPARQGGREFPAAEQLVHDLATMMVQRPDGSFVRQTGHHVEPMQLQVVCRRLWDAMPEDDLSIDPEHLEQFGDVNQALGGYYADSVARIAGDAARERTIREWFDYKLITGDGIRGQVLKGAEESEGLANDTIARILDTHLVRAGTRAGAIWYELAHDRLIEPVRANNLAWRDEHLSEVQQRATLWDHQARPIGMLLAVEEMPAAERWAAGAAVVTAVEQDFLDASRRARAAAERERRQARRIERLAVVSTIVSVLALFALVFAGWKWRDAEKQKQIAQEQSRIASEESERAKREKKAADVERKKAQQQEKIALEREKEAQEARKEAEEQRGEADRQREVAEQQQAKAVESANEAQRQKEEADKARDRAKAEEARAKEEEENAKAAEKEAARLRRLAEAEALAVRTTGMTEEGQHELAALLALQAYRVHLDAGGDAENPYIYSAMRLALRQLGAERRRILRHSAEVRSLAVSPDGRTLAFGDEDGKVHLVDVERFDGELKSAARFDDGVSALAWGAGGRLAAGSFDGALQVLDPGEPASAPRLLNAAGAAVNTLAFQPGTARLAAGDADGQVRLWDLAATEADATVLPPGAEADADVRAVAWGPDGATLAAAVYGRGVLIWDDAAAEEEPRLLAAEPGVRSLAFSNDGSRLAAGTIAGPILVWQPANPGVEPVRLLGHTGRVEAVGFHPRLGLLASGSADRSLRLWDVQRPEAQPIVLAGHERWVWTVAFLPDGEHLFSGSSDRTVRLWTTISEALAQEICETVERNLTRREWNEYLPAEVEYELTCPGLPATAQAAGGS